jgi:hypothetical protein
MIRSAITRFATAAAALLASFIPEQSLEDAELAITGLRRKKPSRGQYWAKTNHVEDHAYHRQPPTKSKSGPKESPRKMVPIMREVFVDASRYPKPNKLINVPKHLRAMMEPRSSTAWARHG